MCLAKAAKSFRTAEEAIRFYYNESIFDEHIPPTIITSQITRAQSDALIFFNFRSDRMRQLTSAFVLPEFDKFPRQEYLDHLHVVTMTEYGKQLPAVIAFPQDNIFMPLAKVLSDAGLNQLHIAETEKYAHVSYFFNGGHEQAFGLEERILIPSQHVSDYSEVPEMSAHNITDRLIRELNTAKYQFVVVNFANTDMVGHTGNLRATIRAVEIVDVFMGDLTDAVLSLGGVSLITSDHGNAEVMFDPQSGEINKEHTNNPVPCILVGEDFVQKKESVPDLSMSVPKGVLADVAPMILQIMDLPVPEEMTGRSLI